jgi:hypothetical protein
MIGLSPAGVIDGIVVFPTMFIIALVLDIVGIVLGCFGMDDFFILDIIGTLTIGLWILLRSGQGGGNSPDKKMEGVAEKKEAQTAKEAEKAATKEAGQVVAKQGEKTAAKGTTKAVKKGFGKALLRVGILAGAEYITYVGDFFTGWLILVAWEFIDDLKNTSLENGD